MVDKQDDKDASKKPKKQKGGGGKHKQKCQGHFFKCQQNKDRHVEKSSHGAFNSVADIKNYIPTEIKQVNDRPRNAYHLTISDGDNLCTISFYQDEKDKDLVRDQSPIFVVNDSKTRKSAFISGKRMERLSKMNFNSREDVIMGLRKCQSWETAHTVIFDGDYIGIGLDNGFAVDKVVPFTNTPNGNNSNV